ncbi:FCS-Like Zinc finger 8-like isoform X3 [Punica granatum]|uniref:FCS-Like Zinc finger 8-like isoform X3 n=1 Tax=Punica granatum TaxID=22663 RepID=A0A6P8DSH2_PUNGR|nr:FCS-Like Zinc finger 8-like isoform X3 [Punica granatum]
MSGLFDDDSCPEGSRFGCCFTLAPSLLQKPTSSSLFSSPRLFATIASSPTKGQSETDAAVMSPTSILDTKPFSSLRSSFQTSPSGHEPEHRRPWARKLDPKGIADALSDDHPKLKSPRPENPVVLFGSHLGIQIPSLPSSSLSSADSPKTPVKFGIKNRSSQLGLCQSPAAKKPVFEPIGSPRVITGCLSTSEMEMSEDYTCVIFHGPVPRTTHIFDNCVVESCCGVVGLSACKEGCGVSAETFNINCYPSQHFLSFCHSCKKNLDQGKDIYMYRGEKAFCSSECRDQVMLLEEGKGKAKSSVRRDRSL